MKCNVGGIDRIGRIVLGVVLLAVGFFAPMETGWKIVVFVLAAIALITGVIRFCPANALLGFNSCEKEDEAPKGES